MNSLTAALIVGIIFYGVYSIFELFAHRKERLNMVEKLDKIANGDISGKINLDIINRKTFSPLRGGLLLIGLGLGLMVSFIIIHMTEVDWDMKGMVMLASLLLFGGIGLVTAFLIERNNDRKKEEKK